MKRRGLIILLALAAFSSQAKANLWETKAQIEKRWGEPIQIKGYPDERIYTYRVDQFRVRVGFLDGFSQYEHYRHLGLPGEYPPLSQAEVETLLRSNSFGQEWKTEGENYWLPDRSVGAFTSAESGKVNSLHLSTAQYDARPSDPNQYVRTGKKLMLSGIVKLRPVGDAQWLVVHSGGYVLEIPWEGPGYPAPAEVKSGKSYSITLLDGEALDNDTRIASLSDREHKDWPDAVDDSKIFVLALIQNGDRILFDRSVCEIHHARMIEERVEVSYGLPAMTDCDRLFPHHRDYILGGCVVQEQKTGMLYVCPICVAACAGYKVAHPKKSAH